MGGFHLVDILIVAGIALALFGPKALQSMARNAGKGVAQAKDMKDKLMSDLPTDDITNLTNSIPEIPLTPRQAVEQLLTPDKEEKKKAKTAEKSVSEKVEEGKNQDAEVK